MASKNSAPETPPSRGISSRLLTMKFMQRAVATGSAQSSPQSASSSAKRRKMDSPLTGEFHSFDEAAIQAAMKQQEATRQAALSKHRVNQADTPWVLSGFSSGARPAKQRGVTYVTFGSIDATDAQEGAIQPTKIGRRRVGNFGSKEDEKSTQKRPEPGDEDDYSSGDSSSDSEAADQTTEGARARKPSSSQRLAAEASRAREFRDKRMKSKVNLNTLTSISGGSSVARGGLSGNGGSGSSRKLNNSIECYRCGNLGHMAASCPSGSKKRRSMD